eukprot:CAMPEP_0179062820 /NCGR_PEP_ID=MMETSP0796-20121207/27120_1 /TAXON_ID=73915 /ORGANISM="Pyrodinium bahamense, Strain pbaha01" /LENGTH=50 /DNA_ID=CAMNT_0020759729 /DNA_START=146 /DNA_END=294 /DNA_ORIENTATION=-
MRVDVMRWEEQVFGLSLLLDALAVSASAAFGAGAQGQELLGHILGADPFG